MNEFSVFFYVIFEKQVNIQDIEIELTFFHVPHLTKEYEFQKQVDMSGFYPSSSPSTSTLNLYNYSYCLSCFA